MLKNTITKLSIIAIIISFVFIANGLILAWTSPSASPPDNNVDAPINVSSNSQYKSGALGVGGIFRGYSNAIFDGTLDVAGVSTFNTINLGGVSRSDWPDLESYYTKEQIDAIISVLELGGTGCPVEYTLYEQSTEAAKCYKDGEVIIIDESVSSGSPPRRVCEGRVVDGVLQSRATCDYTVWTGYPSNIANSGWVNGASSVICPANPAYSVHCSINWKEIDGVLEGHPTWGWTPIYMNATSFGNVLQIN